VLHRQKNSKSTIAALKRFMKNVKENITEKKKEQLIHQHETWLYRSVYRALNFAQRIASGK